MATALPLTPFLLVVGALIACASFLALSALNSCQCHASNHMVTIMGGMKGYTATGVCFDRWGTSVAKLTMQHSDMTVLR